MLEEAPFALERYQTKSLSNTSRLTYKDNSSRVDDELEALKLLLIVPDTMADGSKVVSRMPKGPKTELCKISSRWRSRMLSRA
jgi:hypothetical protein